MGAEASRAVGQEAGWGGAVCDRACCPPASTPLSLAPSCPGPVLEAGRGAALQGCRGVHPLGSWLYPWVAWSLALSAQTAKSCVTCDFNFHLPDS